MPVEAVINAYGNLDEKAILEIIKKRGQRDRMKKGLDEILAKGGHVMSDKSEK